MIEPLFNRKYKNVLAEGHPVVNNLNAVLSAFGIEKVKSRYADSSWVMPKRDANHFEGIAKRFLSDSLFLNYLEDRLDEDRDCGEWENIL